ncbi:DUF6368 family protein [Actinomadura bangladeshensis]|uniref:Uncharacterized protein n=1 Tax=Actinomadura bangladeshensis TaxID=453573 RepID=A0A6L9QBF2_9ACTN|nr:hypothetical protein [Actinomadura bangladeshensis]
MPALGLWLHGADERGVYLRIKSWAAEVGEVSYSDDVRMSLVLEVEKVTRAPVRCVQSERHVLLRVNLFDPDISLQDDYSAAPIIPNAMISVELLQRQDGEDVGLHYVVARFVLRLATFLDLDEIEFNGMAGSEIGMDDSLVERDQSRLILSEIPGRSMEVGTSLDNGGMWYANVVDRTFLSSWMEHPFFHLVKG